MVRVEALEAETGSSCEGGGLGDREVAVVMVEAREVETGSSGEGGGLGGRER